MCCISDSVCTETVQIGSSFGANPVTTASLDYVLNPDAAWFHGRRTAGFTGLYPTGYGAELFGVKVELILHLQNFAEFAEPLQNYPQGLFRCKIGF